MHEITEPPAHENDQAAPAPGGQEAAAVPAGPATELVPAVVPARRMIPVTDLAAHPGNVREDLNLTGEFTASVAAEGVRVPLLITPGPGGGWRVIEGHRRLAAAVRTGLAEVPCDIDPGRAGDEAGQYLDMALANSDAYRVNYQPVEEAAALFAAHEAGASRTRIRKATGRTAAQVKTVLAAGGLPAETRMIAVQRNSDVTLDELALLAEFFLMWTPGGVSVTECDGWLWSDAGVRVHLERRAGLVSGVLVAEAPDGLAEPAALVNRFLRHLLDSGCSPNTAAAYGYDLRYLLEFLGERGLGLEEFGPAAALELLGWLRGRPSRRPAQRLGLSLAVEQGRLLAPATVARALAAVSSFFEWAITAEVLERENPMQRRFDPALARVAARHRPFAGGASRQQPVRRTVRVRLPARLPRPMTEPEVTALLESLTRLRDLAMVLLMLDAGLRPGEVLGLQLTDIAYGRRRVLVGKRDDHPRGARQKSRQERVVDVLEPRTLDAVSRYVLHERPADSPSPFVFLVGGSGPRRMEPLSYSALARLFARRLDALGLRTPDKTPHALRHTHATAMWEGGMRELALMRRLGHASPESVRIYTRVSDEQVRSEYAAALETRR
jgi:integrase